MSVDQPEGVGVRLTVPSDELVITELHTQPQKRRVVVFLVDVSFSMNANDGNGARRIDALNRALDQWVPQVRAGGAAELRDVECAVITFGYGGVRVTSGDPRRAAHEDGGAFVPAAQLQLGPYEAGGVTPMVEAIQRGIDLALARNRYLGQQHGLLTGQVRVIMFSDGGPTDGDGRPTEAWRASADRIRTLVGQRRLQFFAFGVPGVNEQIMRGLTEDGYFPLGSMDFKRLLDLMLVATASNDPYSSLRSAMGGG